MKIFSSVADVNDELAGGALTIGNFDGVHRGHQELINKTIQLKGTRKCGVLSFSPHPHTVLAQGAPHVTLMSDTQKSAVFAKLGLDVAILHRIDKDFLTLSPENFVVKLLVRLLKVQHVVVGYDFRFGQHARGDITLLQQLAQQYNFAVHIVAPVEVHGQRCSTTAIKKALHDGDVVVANAMLGTAFCLRGLVVHGQKKGRDLGFKTANLLPGPTFMLNRGIYASITRVPHNGGHRDLLSATSVGVRPTVTSDPTLVVETHCLDEKIDLYGSIIQIYFIKRIRDEIKFSSLPELQNHVQLDFLAVRDLARNQPNLFTEQLTDLWSIHDEPAKKYED